MLKTYTLLAVIFCVVAFSGFYVGHYSNKGEDYLSSDDFYMSLNIHSGIRRAINKNNKNDIRNLLSLKLSSDVLLLGHLVSDESGDVAKQTFYNICSTIRKLSNELEVNHTIFKEGMKVFYEDLKKSREFCDES